MLLFTGTVNTTNNMVICFEARPTVEGMAVLVEHAIWGMTAPQHKIDEISRAILRCMAIEAVVTRFIPSFGEQVIRKLDSTRAFYILGEDVRVWLDLELVKKPNEPVKGGPFDVSGTVQ